MVISMKDNGKTTKAKDRVKSNTILGTYIFSNGEKYEGDWKGGKMSGTGTKSIL